jgi:hypothetical protein
MVAIYSHILYISISHMLIHSWVLLRRFFHLVFQLSMLVLENPCCLSWFFTGSWKFLFLHHVTHSWLYSYFKFLVCFVNSSLSAIICCLLFYSTMAFKCHFSFWASVPLGVFAILTYNQYPGRGVWAQALVCKPPGDFRLLLLSCLLTPKGLLWGVYVSFDNACGFLWVGFCFCFLRIGLKTVSSMD